MQPGIISGMNQNNPPTQYYNFALPGNPGFFYEIKVAAAFTGCSFFYALRLPSLLNFLILT